MAKNIWVKPSGVELEVNESPEVVAYIRKLGWKPKEESPKKDTLTLNKKS